MDPIPLRIQLERPVDPDRPRVRNRRRKSPGEFDRESGRVTARQRPLALDATVLRDPYAEPTHG